MNRISRKSYLLWTTKSLKLWIIIKQCCNLSTTKFKFLNKISSFKKKNLNNLHSLHNLSKLDEEDMVDKSIVCAEVQARSSNLQGWSWLSICRWLGHWKSCGLSALSVSRGCWTWLGLAASVGSLGLGASTIIAYLKTLNSPVLLGFTNECPAGKTVKKLVF